MKKITYYSLIISTIVLFVFVFSACKKSSDDSSPSNTNTVKSLNKTTIAPKKWYSEGSAYVHDLQAGGGYGNQGGSWKWKNDTDTLAIVTQSGFPESYWKVYWNTDHEMSCEKVGTFTALLYKDSAW